MRRLKKQTGSTRREAFAAATGAAAAAIALGAAILALQPIAGHAATATRGSFGALSNGQPVEVVALANKAGVKARIITYGAALQALETPDRNGKLDIVTLGYDAIAGYEQHPQYFGATVGRYANRIAGGRFSLDGHAYQLITNEGQNTLHGGPQGYDKRLWSITDVKSDKQAASVTLTRVSPDGEEGFPGNLTVRVTYTLTEANTLSLSYSAVTDKPTVVNLTNHSIFNLAGVSSGRGAMDSTLQVSADAFTPVDSTLIPTGEIKPVAGSPFDLREPVVIGERVRDARDAQVELGRGIDHNFVIRGGLTAKPKLAATMIDARSGRGMTVLTTEPGLQVYTGNFLDGTVPGHGRQLMRQGDGVALEAQHFPDSPNRPDFPSTRLDPGQTYTQTTVLHLFIAPR